MKEDGLSPVIHNVDEMKSTVIQYSTINNELRQLQEQAKQLKNKRNMLSEKMKVFMRFNHLELCHISENVQTDIRKIRYVHRDKKQRCTLKMVETYFEQFFDDIDIDRFLKLNNHEKSEAFFDYIDKKRPCTVLESIIIR
jgi:archaellum component FlaC